MDGIRIYFFGQLTDVTGVQQVTVPVMLDTKALEQWLLLEYPGLAAKKYRIAVNNQLIRGTTSLARDSEVALLPPFSGG
ncbi:MAG: MoaD/ThiS family protein [Chitinophagaceae bacterium]